MNLNLKQIKKKKKSFLPDGDRLLFQHNKESSSTVISST